MEEIGKTPNKGMKVKYKKKYKEIWETEPGYCEWLAKSKKGIFNFYCKACKFDGVAGLSEITKHSNRRKHLLNMKKFKNNAILHVHSKLIWHSAEISRLQADIKDNKSNKFSLDEYETSILTKEAAHGLKIQKCESSLNTVGKDEKHSNVNSNFLNENNLASSISSSVDLGDIEEMFGRYLANELRSIKNFDKRKRLKQKILNLIYDTDETSDEEIKTTLPIFVSTPESIPSPKPSLEI